jgi:hypothetical protein
LLKKQTGDHERRKHIRIMEPLPIKFKIFERGNSGKVMYDWKECRTRDLGRGGVCVEIAGNEKDLNTLKEFLEKNPCAAELDMTLSFNGQNGSKGEEQNIRLTGEIVWGNIWDEMLCVGVNFAGISEEHEKLISDFIIENYLGKYGITKTIL